MDGRVLVGEVGGEGGDAGRMEEGHHQHGAALHPHNSDNREGGWFNALVQHLPRCGYIHLHH